MKKNYLENEILKLRDEFEDFKNNIKDRDWLIRTNFFGNLVTKEYKELFKKQFSISNQNRIYEMFFDYNTIKKQIINYNFTYMQNFIYKLEEYRLRELDYIELLELKNKNKVNKK